MVSDPHNHQAQRSLSPVIRQEQIMKNLMWYLEITVDVS